MDMNEDLRPYADKAEEIATDLFEELARRRDKLVEENFCGDKMADNIVMNAVVEILVSSVSIAMGADRLSEENLARFRTNVDREFHEFLGHLLAKYSKEGTVAFVEIPRLPQSELIDLLRHLRSSGGGHRESCVECKKVDEILG